MIFLIQCPYQVIFEKRYVTNQPKKEASAYSDSCCNMYVEINLKMEEKRKEKTRKEKAIKRE
jgi:hypothetical protein